MTNQSIEFFDTQFQKQVATSDFALNPFERATLDFVRGRTLAEVLDREEEIAQFLKLRGLSHDELRGLE